MPVGYGDAWDIDIRALPVLFVMLLAMVRVGKRGWQLAPIAVLLFVVRIGDVQHYFHKIQPELAGIAQSFTMTPENAKVLPVSESSGEDAIYRFYGHFWAYGVIERGWYSPYMFRLPGLLPLQMTKELYDPDGFWNLKLRQRSRLETGPVTITIMCGRGTWINSSRDSTKWVTRCTGLIGSRCTRCGSSSFAFPPSGFITGENKRHCPGTFLPM